MIPSSIDMMIAPAELPSVYERDVDFWSQRCHGIDVSPVRPLAVNNRYPVHVPATALLAEGAQLARIDLARVEHDRVEGTIDVAVQRPGTFDGFCCWFTATLVGDILVGNEPGRSTTNYGQAFLPIERGVAVDEGDRVRARVTCSRGVEFRWQVSVTARRASEPSAVFDQSTFCA